MTDRLRTMLRRWPRGMAVFAVLAYQALVRPFLVGTCRYHPSCSHYAIESFRTHGLFRGTRLAVARVLRCHPFARGGVDPVPPQLTSTPSRRG